MKLIDATKIDVASKDFNVFRARITPECADTWLTKHNNLNRPVAPTKVEEWGIALKANRWMLTNQGIGFDVKGQNVDGQHRLQACRDTRMPFEALVVVGLEEETREIIDIGKRRSDADVVSMRTGTRHSNLFVGTGRYMISIKSRSALPRVEFIDFLERHKNAITFACGLGNERLVTVAPVLAVVARAYYNEDIDKLTRFVKTLCSGIPEAGDKCYQPALMLRRYLTSGKRDQDGRVGTYNKTETALRAYLDGEVLPKLYPASKELFSLHKG